jgi:3-dehydro-4-phosphotetronate decarboxylase
VNEIQARDEICRVGRSLFERGYVHGTAGNISVRLEDGFLMTPTDACLGYLDPARIARIDAAGQQIDGERASKTLALHTAIYAAALPFDSGTRCVIHTHSTHAVALSLRCQTSESTELLEPITPYFVMKVGHTPLLRYQRPGDLAVAEQVAALIKQYGRAGTPLRAVMLQRLGPNVWHDSAAQAMAVLEELEETARITLLTGLPAPEPLTELQIDELRRAFGARW